MFPDYYYDNNDIPMGGEPWMPAPVPDAPAAPPVASGPPWTAANPPPPGSAPPGTDWMLNPTTGQFEPVPHGQMPPWGPRADAPETPWRQVDDNMDQIGPPPAPQGSIDGPQGPQVGFTGAGGAPSGGGNWPSYQGLPFDAGPMFTYKDFVSPSGESVLQEPGFQFRLDQGRKALESSAAGKGVLRSGGTLKDILGYGQNFAAQEYGNVWNRALTEYDTNRNNAADIWGKQYGQRKDAYTFGEDNNRFGFNAKQKQAELDAREAFDRWAKQGDWTRDIAGFGLD